jgi:hypothetical protein
MTGEVCTRGKPVDWLPVARPPPRLFEDIKVSSITMSSLMSMMMLLSRS